MQCCVSETLLRWMIITDVINMFVHSFSNMSINKYRNSWKGLMAQAIRFHYKCNGNPMILLNFMSTKREDIQNAFVKHSNIGKIITEDSILRDEVKVSDYLGFEEINKFFKFRCLFRESKVYTTVMYSFVHQAFFPDQTSNVEGNHLSQLPRKCIDLIMEYVNYDEIEDFGLVVKGFSIFYGIEE